MEDYKIKVNYPLIEHFTDDDLYKFTMCNAVLQRFPNVIVTYRFQDRDNKVYPKGFDKELENQIEYLRNLRITDEEVAYMKNKCYYLPAMFFDYLKGMTPFDTENYVIHQDEEGHLTFEYTGRWCNEILYEVKFLAIINRLYYLLTNQSEVCKNVDYDKYYEKTYNKAKRILSAGLNFAEFGTRRRYSFVAQETAVRACKDAYVDLCNKHADNSITNIIKRHFKKEKLGVFTGTSNVYLAMKYNLTPIGTMAHEWICGIAGLYGSPIEANYIAMEEWEKVYNGALGVYLYDSFGVKMFEKNFTDKYARSFDGLRVDSGDNMEQFNILYDIYRKHRVNPESKSIMFSNALDTDSYIRLGTSILKEYENASIGAGIGTHLTNDFVENDINPCNNVIKLIFIAWDANRNMLPTCKFSNESGKYIGGDEKIAEMWKYQIELNTKE